MRNATAIGLCSCILALLWGAQPLRAAPSASRDFDFAIGAWETRVLHLQHSPGKADDWAVWSGRVVAAKVWGGRANLQEIHVDATSGPIEELRLCLYRPRLHRWDLYMAEGDDAVLGKPMMGRFEGGVGSFYDQEDYRGRAIFVRHRYSRITRRAYHWQQAFSDDGGTTWRPNWNVTLTLESSTPSGQPGAAATPTTGADAQAHGFDFAWGEWRTEISYLQDPFAAAGHWMRIHGHVSVRKVWGGRGNLEEIEATGPHGPIEGLTLRLYDPAARQWRLYRANSSDGVMDDALVGGFKNGRGVFYNQATYAGRTVFVRNVYFDVTADSYRFEQALSADGGKSWRRNFNARLTRVKN